MKSIIVSIVLIFVAGTAYAQIGNEGFEEWQGAEEMGEREVPAGWDGSSFGSGKTDEAHTGNFAATVWNWYYYAKGYFVTGGQGFLLWDFERAGLPIQYKPARLTGFYRYVLGTNQQKNDSGVIVVLLKKYNQSREAFDTIAFAQKRLGPADAYTQFTLDLPDRAPGITPDSIVIMMISSDSAFCDGQSDGNCCYLSVDDLQLSTASGVSYSADAYLNPARVYPNPVRSTARIEWSGKPGRSHRLRIFSIAGELIATREGITECSVLLDRTGLTPGEYLFEVSDESNIVATRGRFVVE